MMVKPEGKQHGKDAKYQQVGAMQNLAYLCPVFTELYACIRKNIAEGKGTEEAPKTELGEVHTSDACRQ